MPDESCLNFDELVKRKNELYINRISLLRQFEEITTVYNKVQQQLEKICDHEWQKDFSSYDHRTCYECEKCGGSK